MDKTTLIVIVILLIAIGIFIGIQMGDGGTTGNAVRSSGQYASQVAGGGCGW